MRCFAFVIGLLVALLGAPGSTHAEDLLVLPLGGTADAAQRDQVVAATQRRFVQEGFIVAGPAELAHRVPPSRLAVETPEAAVELAVSLSIPRVVCVTTWVSEGRVTELALALRTLAGGRVRRTQQASATLNAGESVDVAMESMVRQVLAAERAASVLDPTRPSTVATPAPSTPQEVAPPRAPATEPLFGVLGPGLLAALGTASMGLGIWAMLEPTCSLRGASGICLRGESNDIGAGIALVSLGVLGLGGAIAWWVAGAATPQDNSRIELSLGPLGLRLRGAF